MRDRLWYWLAQRLPRRLVYHTVIMAGANYSTSPVGSERPVPEITWDETARWLEGGLECRAR